MTPRCPRCNELLRPDETRTAAQTVRCGSCGTEYLIRLPPPAPPPPPPPPMPMRFEVTETQPGLTIRWNDRFGLWIDVPATLVFGGLMVPFVRAGHFAAALFAVATVYFALRAVATAVNHTYVRVDATAIVWSTEPLSFAAQRRIDLADVDQLFTIREARHDGEFEHVNYVLNVRTRQGEIRKLADLDLPTQAHWLEHAIERHLGIEDRPVAGELPRGQW